MSPGQKRKQRDWYTVSVDTLRGWGFLALLLVLAGGGWLGFQVWERYALRSEAARAIDEAGALFQRARGAAELAGVQSEYEAAWAGLEHARELYGRARYEDALGRATRSREMLLSLLNASRHGGSAGAAQFIVVEGRVEYRRGDSDSWEPARMRVTLQPGDYVKTSASGSAEIMFTDGTLYTVRPDTLFLVSPKRGGSGGEQTVELQYGWINLNTAQSGSKVATPQAEAVIDDQSEAVVSYDESRREGNFTAFRGGVRVASTAGEVRELGSLQTVAQAQGRLSAVRLLPPPPALYAPQDNADVDFDRVKRLRLAWEDVDGGARYALQVSRNKLFVDNVIDVADRERTDATLGVQGEGSFLWRVAAINDDQLRGPWSPPGRFRIASFETRETRADEEPPVLEILGIQSYGPIFIVSGRTEPGAAVLVNGESVTVEADGSFTKTIQLTQAGWGFLEVTATDTAGNPTTQRSRVFVENL